MSLLILRLKSKLKIKKYNIIVKIMMIKYLNLTTDIKKQ